MIIIIRNVDSVVLYAEPNLHLDANGAAGLGWKDANTTSGNSSIADVASLPAGWTGGVWSYVNGAWGVADQAHYNKIQQYLAAQQAQATFDALIAGGITLTSTGTPALNGTYSTHSVAQANISAIQIGIGSGMGLPGGSATFAYLDSAGGQHQFSAANFTAFAIAVRDFVYHSLIALATIEGGGTATFPLNTVTIA